MKRLDGSIEDKLNWSLLWALVLLLSAWSSALPNRPLVVSRAERTFLQSFSNAHSVSDELNSTKFLSVFAKLSFVPEIAVHERIYYLGIIFLVLLQFRICFFETLFFFTFVNFPNPKHNTVQIFFLLLWSLKYEMFVLYSLNLYYWEPWEPLLLNKDFGVFFPKNIKHPTFIKVYKSMFKYRFAAFVSNDPEWLLLWTQVSVCLLRARIYTMSVCGFTWNSLMFTLTIVIYVFENHTSFFFFLIQF